MNLFVFGLGYSALAFIEQYCNTFVSISGTVRETAKAEALAGQGIKAFVWQGDKIEGNEELAAAITDAEDIIVSVPPGAEGDIVLKQLHRPLRETKLLRSIIYLSTVGVYGNHDGAWVDEETPPQPSSERSQLRLLAEQDWTLFARAKGANLHILRLAGIYGPGRSALVSLRAGKARRIIKPGQVFNRIHVKDIATTIAACLNRQHGRESGIWNVSDDEPAPPQDVVAYAAHLLGVEPPPEIPFEQADLSPMGRSFYAEIKRVSNARIKTDLGVTLTYPTYREGLVGSLEPSI